jgi:type IV secretory pathway VirB9-like protein
MPYPWRPVMITLLALLAAWGCEPKEAPEPPVAPPAEDLSTWTVPTIVQPAPHKAPPQAVRPVNRPAGPDEKVYKFIPGKAVEALVATGIPLDIILQPGEKVRGIVDGDRAPLPEGHQYRRWEVKETVDGSGAELRPHLLITASEPGLTNGFVVTTTRRIYYITCKSVAKSPTRVLRWHYDSLTADQGAPEAEPEPPLLPLPDQPRLYHVGYEMQVSQPAPTWVPRFVVDDGKKTYIIYPEVTLFDSVPLLRLLGPNGPQLVNSLQYLNVVIVDQLVARAELRLGTGERAQVVTITRGKLRTIQCPGDAACPVWPTAAAVLAGRPAS